ncbi:MAG: class I SAM-dependent methyltransferase [Deltaproteobacteria bacterium]|nr:MAG: class I SAM-dependent methyltransferase [Deltaproteobacteria bacterium]
MTEKDRLKWIYSSKDNQELAERYDRWANDYDTELEDNYGWATPRIVTDLATKYVSTTGRLLDAGAGTGLVGQCLHEEGYRDLVGIDLSEGMLEKAKQKKVYRELYQMVLGESLNFPDGGFDAVVCAGVLTFGHAPPDSLTEMIRITRPQGHIIFSMRSDAHEELGFKERQEVLEVSGRWKLVEVSQLHQAFSKKEPDILHHVWVYRVL